MPNPENLKGHEFKPGESGNPAGRPPDILTLIRKLSKDEWQVFLVNIWGASKTKLEEYLKSDPPINLGIVARGLIRDYIKGEMINWEKVAERLYGKVPQKTELTGGEGEPFGPPQVIIHPITPAPRPEVPPTNGV